MSRGGTPDAVCSVAVAHDGKTVATATADGGVRDGCLLSDCRPRAVAGCWA